MRKYECSCFIVFKLKDHYFYSFLYFIADFENPLQSQASMRRSCIVALAVFLTKMHLGVRNQVLASMFHFDNKRSISRITHSVRKAMMSNFGQKYLGFRHISC